MTLRGASPAGAPTRFVRIRLPLLVEHAAAHGTEAVRDVVLVEHRDGPAEHWGWGECPTLSTGGYVGGTTEEAWTAIVAFASGAIAPAELPLAVRAACRDAALDGELRRRGRSLSEHLGATLTSVPVCRVIAAIGADRPAAIAGALDDAAGRDGMAMIKVKIDGADVGGLRAARRQIGPTLALAADANGTIGELTPEIAAGLAEVGLTYLEQPARPGTEALASWSRGRAPVPVALDESIVSLDALAVALALEPFALPLVISIKPSRLGGIAVSAEAVRLVRAGGARWFVGGMLETGIGRAGALAVAAMGGAQMLPTDLGPSSRYFDRDVCEPHRLTADGRIRVPDGPGIGRRPDPSRLASIAVDEVVVAAR